MAEGVKVGYVRVSTADQNVDRQMEALKDLKLDKVFTDHASGKDTDRPAFTRMMEYLREGDSLFVASMDRLARDLSDLLKVTSDLHEKKVAVTFLKENVKLSPDKEADPMTKLLLSLMGAVAEFERALIRERQAEGIALAKQRGKYRGRKPIAREIIEKGKERVALGIPLSKVARELKVGRATLYRYLKQEEKEGQEPLL